MGNKASADGRRNAGDAGQDIDNEDALKKNKKNKRENSKKKNENSVSKTDGKEDVDSRIMDVKIYRSTSTIDEVNRRSKSASESEGPDIRIYRRSMNENANDHPTSSSFSRGSSKSQTLPRSFGRNGPNKNGTGGSSADDPEPIFTRSRPDGGTMRTGDSVRPMSSKGPVGDGKDAASAGSLDGKSGRPSSRISNQSGPMSSTVTAEDFPDTASTIRRLNQFEACFVDRFIALYSALPETVQLSALSIAVRRDANLDLMHAEAATVSLWNYLRSTPQCDLPIDLPVDQFALTIPPELFHRALQLRCGRSGSDDMGRALNETEFAGALQMLVRDILATVASEAATSVATAFEYQIALLGDGLPCKLLADRAADCAIDYLKKTNRHLDVNAVVSGVVRGRPTDCHRVATVSVFIGRQRELKWNIDEVLCRAGLRKDHLLVSAGLDGVAGYGMPWRFYTSTISDDVIDPLVYGYRGHLLLRDFVTEASSKTGSTPTVLYRFDTDEEKMFNAEVVLHPDDHHRFYRPYRRLVGADVMEAYSSRSSNNAVCSLADFVQNVHGEAWKRDDVQPICRPIVAVQLRRPQQQQVAVRPRCVSDTEEFSRQHASRRTWSPAAAAAASSNLGTFRVTNDGHRAPLPVSQQSVGSPVCVSPPPADIYRRPPNAATIAVGDVSQRKTVSSVTTNIIIQKKPSPVGESDNFLRSQGFVPESNVRRSFMTSSARDNEFVAPAAQRRQPSSSTSSNSPVATTASVATGFPTIEELFAKELRAMKAKTIHVTDFPVFEDQQPVTSVQVERPTTVAFSDINANGALNCGDVVSRKPSDGNERSASSSLTPNNNNTSPIVGSYLPSQYGSSGDHRQMSFMSPANRSLKSPVFQFTTATDGPNSEFVRCAPPHTPTLVSVGDVSNNCSNMAVTAGLDGAGTKTLIISNI